MSYGFDENMGKVPIEPILNQLEQTYQSNVNTIYNTIKNQGTTPAGKTPAQIATAINTMASAKFNAGRAQGDAEGYARAQNVSWSQTFEFEAGSYQESGLYGNPIIEYGLKNVVSASLTNTTSQNVIAADCINASGQTIGSQTINAGATAAISIPNGAIKLRLTNLFTGFTGTITFNYKCQVLR